jgi:NAD(P)-dependent dehydrogenase (short-subunit alcohol dehydrogenase family)
MEAAMERALIVGSSGGIGAAVAETLDARGLELTRISRRREGFDITDPASVERHLGPLKGPYDLILIASGILAPSGAAPEKSLEQIDAAVLARVMAVNAIGPALVMRHVPRLLPPKGRSVVAVLTARVGSIGDNTLGGWYSYRASKAAANQLGRDRRCAASRHRRDGLHPRLPQP